MGVGLGNKGGRGGGGYVVTPSLTSLFTTTLVAEKLLEILCEVIPKKCMVRPDDGDGSIVIRHPIAMRAAFFMLLLRASTIF